jgi:hypothetical protein
MIRTKLSGRYSNMRLGVNKLFNQFDPERTGSVGFEDFSGVLKGFLVGIDEGEVAGVSSLYSQGTNKEVNLKAFLERMLDSDLGVPERSKEAENEGIGSEVGDGDGVEKQFEVLPMSQIARTGSLNQRLAKFRAGVKGLFASKVGELVAGVSWCLRFSFARPGYL